MLTLKFNIASDHENANRHVGDAERDDDDDDGDDRHRHQTESANEYKRRSDTAIAESFAGHCCCG